MMDLAVSHFWWSEGSWYDICIRWYNDYVWWAKTGVCIQVILHYLTYMYYYSINTILPNKTTKHTSNSQEKLHELHDYNSLTQDGRSTFKWRPSFEGSMATTIAKMWIKHTKNNAIQKQHQHKTFKTSLCLHTNKEMICIGWKNNWDVCVSSQSTCFPWRQQW